MKLRYNDVLLCIGCGRLRCGMFLCGRFRWGRLHCGRCQRVLARFDCIQLEYIWFCGIRYSNVGWVSFRGPSFWCCCFPCGGLWCGGFCLCGCLGYDSGKFDVEIMRTADFKSAPAVYSMRRSIRSGCLFDTAVYSMQWSIRCGDLFDDAAVYSTMRRSIRCGGLLNKLAVFYWCWWNTKLQCNEYVVVFGFRIPFGFTVFLWLIRKLRSELQYDFYSMKD